MAGDGILGGGHAYCMMLMTSAAKADTWTERSNMGEAATQHAESAVLRLLVNSSANDMGWHIGSGATVSTPRHTDTRSACKAHRHTWSVVIKTEQANPQALSMFLTAINLTHPCRLIPGGCGTRNVYRTTKSRHTMRASLAQALVNAHTVEHRLMNRSIPPGRTGIVTLASPYCASVNVSSDSKDGGIPAHLWIS